MRWRRRRLKRFLLLETKLANGAIVRTYRVPLVAGRYDFPTWVRTAPGGIVMRNSFSEAEARKTHRSEVQRWRK